MLDGSDRTRRALFWLGNGIGDDINNNNINDNVNDK